VICIRNITVYFLTTFNINGFTGTPSRTRTEIAAVSEHCAVELIPPENSHPLSSGSKVDITFTTLFEKVFFPFKKTIKLVVLFFQLLEKQPKILHCVLDDSAFVACLYKLLFGARVVYEVHAISKLYSPIRFSFKEWFSVKFSDKIIVMSHKMKELLVKFYGANPSKITVIWGPIDGNIFKAPSKKKKAFFIVGYGGNDSKYQGINTILGAARILEKEKNILFKFVGFNGTKYGKLPNVKFVGKIDEDKLFAKELSEADLFVSAYEGEFGTGAYPHKVSTYLTIGRPVIASDISDCKLILRKSHAGQVFSPGNSQELAQAIKKYGKMSSTELLSLQKNARRFAELNFDSNLLFKKLKLLYFD
jgi:glycosyltransferase involved in cell wall biosynthesis